MTTTIGSNTAPIGLTRHDRRMVRTMRWFGRFHRAVLRVSGGHVLGRWFGGSDVVLLTVTGRTSGRPHTVTLMSLPDGGGPDRFVVASQGGVDREPLWWLNLQADPRAEIEVAGRRRVDGRVAVVAELVGDDERGAIWDRFVATYAGFDDYQARVRRQIAVIRLRRVG